MTRWVRRSLIVILWFGTVSAFSGAVLGVAAIATQRRMPHSPIAATIAGFGLIIWIFVELAIVGFDWLQVVYFAVGAVELILVLVFLRVLSPVTQERFAG